MEYSNEDIVDMYKKGMSYAKISAKTKIPESTIMDRIKIAAYRSEELRTILASRRKKFQRLLESHQDIL